MPLRINCDMGEGCGQDAALMPLIHAANICCGYHSGDESTMRETLRLAKVYGVEAGAHPSFADLKNFGRDEQYLPDGELFELVKTQLHQLNAVAMEEGITLTHVKPHGALYNLSAKDPVTASVIARAVKCFNPHIILYGLSGSHSITEARKLGLEAASEVFADRAYRDDGSLAPRNLPGSVFEKEEEVIRQLQQLLQYGTVTSLSGKIIALEADTICIHGDGAHATAFATLIRKMIDAHA